MKSNNKYYVLLDNNQAENYNKSINISH